MSATRRSPAEPEDLMRDFRGGGLMRFAILALVVHAIVILATSIPWLRETFMGSATAGMTEEEKLEAAVNEATAKISSIAKEHGVSPLELGARFGGNGKKSTPESKTPTDKPKAPPSGATPPAPAAPEPPAGQSPPAETAPAGQAPAPSVPPGPSLPAVDDNVDLFK
jgi:hypothetical protein